MMLRARTVVTQIMKTLCRMNTWMLMQRIQMAVVKM
jgi:hypothetical protein